MRITDAADVEAVGAAGAPEAPGDVDAREVVRPPLCARAAKATGGVDCYGLGQWVVRPNAFVVCAGVPAPCQGAIDRRAQALSESISPAGRVVAGGATKGRYRPRTEGALQDAYRGLAEWLVREVRSVPEMEKASESWLL